MRFMRVEAFIVAVILGLACFHANLFAQEENEGQEGQSQAQQKADKKTAESEAELVESVRQADARGEPVLVLGGGSNVVVSDDGFAGTTVHVASRGVTLESSYDRLTVTAAA